jgi:hypothetical protein
MYFMTFFCSFRRAKCQHLSSYDSVIRNPKITFSSIFYYEVVNTFKLILEVQDDAKGLCSVFFSIFMKVVCRAIMCSVFVESWFV